MDAVSVPIPTAFVVYVQPLLARLGYLYPGVDWSFDSETSILKARYTNGAYSADTLSKEAFFQLYREKVYHDTLDLRRKIYEAI